MQFPPFGGIPLFPRRHPRRRDKFIDLALNEWQAQVRSLIAK
jgi:hypothetical protein